MFQVIIKVFDDVLFLRELDMSKPGKTLKGFNLLPVIAEFSL